MTDIFLSYNRDDRDTMEKLRDNLTAVGFNVWIDVERLKVGIPDWEQAIEQAIQDVDAMVVILSPSANKSQWVRNEIALAKVHKIPILPALASGDRGTAIPASLITAQYADLRGRADFESGFRKLVEGLSTQTGHEMVAYAVGEEDERPVVRVEVSGHVEGAVVIVGRDVGSDLKVAVGNTVEPRQAPTRAGIGPLAIVVGLGAIAAVIVVVLLATGGFGGGGAAAEEPAEEPAAEEPAAEERAEEEPSPAEEELAPAEEEAAVPQLDVVRVYASWPLQGSMLPIGEGMRNATNLALEHYLADNPDGPGGYEVEFVFNDDASPVTGSWDGTVEAEIAQKCVSDESCLVYFGTYNSGAAAVSQPITNQAGIAQITPANTNPCLTFQAPVCAEGETASFRPSGDTRYFRTHGNDFFQGLAAASWAKCLGHEKIYILDDRQMYGKGVADAVEAHAEVAGVEIVAHEGVESTDIDFRSLMARIQASGATLVYGGFVIDSGGVQVVQQMSNLGLFDRGIQFMGPDGLFDTALIEQVGGPDVIGDDNVLLTFPGLTPTQVRDASATGAAFYNDYEEWFGEVPDFWDAYAYQSALIILDSIARAAEDGPPTRASVLAAMKETNFEGLTGNIQFDENGDPLVTQMGGSAVRGGDIVPIEPISTTMHEDC